MTGPVTCERKKMYAVAILEFGSGVDGTEGTLGPAIIADLEIGRFEEIKIVAVPQIGLDDLAQTGDSLDLIQRNASSIRLRIRWLAT
jgi:hypothetical protein